MLGVKDIVWLHFTLVSDDVLPHGYFADFAKLEGPIRRSSERSLRLAISVTDAEAEMSLEMEKKRKFYSALGTASTTDQLLIAADMKPRRFRSKWQRVCYEGPTARKDAESAERVRRVALLADLLRNTPIQMGRLLRDSPTNSQLLGRRRRAGTLHSRVRVIQKFLGWLALAHNLVYPTHWKQLIEFMQVRLSESCVRGSLKLIHLSYIFMQEVAGVDDKLTDSVLYDVTKKELQAPALPGRPPRQAPRFPAIILAALEDNVVSQYSGR